MLSFKITPRKDMKETQFGQVFSWNVTFDKHGIRLVTKRVVWYFRKLNGDIMLLDQRIRLVYFSYRWSSDKAEMAASFEYFTLLEYAVIIWIFEAW